jgi:hypothetical protein
MVGEPNSATNLSKLSTTTWVSYSFFAFGPALVLSTLLRDIARGDHISLILN